MDAIDVAAVSDQRLSAEQRAWTEDQLGRQPGAWDGYSAIPDNAVAKEAFGIVGNIHGYNAKVGHDIVALGALLIRLKQLLPHGQFMDCVKAEFGWGHTWANQLMQISERFANCQLTGNLPSSAMVLALLAQAGADDDTVQQAADEGWSVAETKRRVSKVSGPRQPQPAETLALNRIRKGEVDRLRAALTLAESEVARLKEALALADRAQVVNADQVMAEQRLRELGRQRFIAGTDADFHKMKDGSWIRLPHAGRVDAIAPPQPPADTSAPELSHSPSSEVLTVAQAAGRLGMTKRTLTQLLTPKATARRSGPLVRTGQAIEREKRGMVRLTPVGPQLLNC